jgi:hypothetical protein
MGMNIKLDSRRDNSFTYALENIQALPLSLDQPHYRQYPAMKLGRLEQIDFFSFQLCRLAMDVLSNNKHIKNNDWVLTAPAFYQLPAAANLLARKVHKLLQQLRFDIDLIEPRLSQEQIEIRNQDDLKNYYDYSKNGLQQRIAERQRVQQSKDTEALKSLFSDKSVIVINDINVTGTQQYFMQQRFDELNVRSCHWLYIFTIENSLAQRHPEIEHQINNSQLQDLDSYAALLADSQTQHTARCIGRLFNESIENFRYLISVLDREIQEKIYQLARKEGRYNSELFAEKMHILADSKINLMTSTY